MAFPPTNLVPPTLSDYQLSYNGVLLGASTPRGYLKVEGLVDLASIDSGDEPLPRSDGELIGLDLMGGRDITISVYAKTDGTSLQSTLQYLASATVVGYSTEQPLWFQLPNLPTLCAMCRPRKRAVPIDSSYQVGIAYPALQFHATDPNLYAASQTVTVGL